MSKLGHLSKQLNGEVTFTILPLFCVTYPNNPSLIGAAIKAPQITSKNLIK